MIDYTAVRTYLAGLLVGVDEDLTVVEAAIEGIPAFPAVVVGLPSTDFDTASALCGPAGTTSWPISVLVARPGTNDAHQVHQLEELWPKVAGAVDAAIDTDSTFAGLATAVQLDKAEFGLIYVGGQPYPSQTVTVTITG